MANTNTNVLPKMLAQGVLALRQNAIGPQVVNRDYSSLAAQRGNVVNVPIPSAITARAVTAAVAFAANVDYNPTVAVVTLDHWMEAPFQMSDNDFVSVMEGVVPMQASEAVKALGNDADVYLWGKHVGFYGYAGSPGSGAFSGSLTAAANARLVLNRQLAPPQNRSAILDPTAETNLLLNSQILQFDTTGSSQGIIEGSIGRKLGFDWYMDQNIPTFTPGTGWATGYIASTVGGAVGDTTLNIINSTASGTILVGDLFSYGSGQYVVTAAANVTATTQKAITFTPALATAIATGAAITVVGTAYTVNLALHRDAMTWASRPLTSTFSAGNVFQSPTDPVSGIALRLELSRQYKQETYSYDYLAGANIIRAALGCKILG